MSLDNYGSMGSVEGSASRDDETLLGKGAVKERDEKITKDAYIFVLCAALNSCNLGYDVGVSTKVGRLVQKDFQLSRLEREIFIGSINFWAMFGSLGAHYLTDNYGRRRTFLVAAIGFIVGLVLTASGTTFPSLMMGRTLVGLGVGVGLAIDPLYIAEVTPAQHRGELVTWAEIALNVGILLGFSTNRLFKGLSISTEWRAMVLFGCIFPALMISCIVLHIMPESPRWLVSKGRIGEAESVLARIYTTSDEVQAEREHIEKSIELEKEANDAVGWEVIMRPSPGIRRMLVVGIGTVVAQQAVGIDAIQYYLLDVMAQSGIRSESQRDTILILLGLLKLFMAWLGGRLFDSQGRRKLLFLSLTGMAVSLIMLAFAFQLEFGSTSTHLTIAGLALYIATFSIGMGPGGWLIASEVFAISIRAKAMSLGTFLNRVTATWMSSTFLSTANVIGWSGFFILLALVCLAVLGFLYLFLPETKGRSLEDMGDFFARITGDSSFLETEERLARGGSRKFQPSN